MADEFPYAPCCTACGTSMALGRVMPKFAGLRELRTFFGRQCGEVTTDMIEEESLARKSDTAARVRVPYGPVPSPKAE